MDNIQYISLDINNNKINQNIYTKQYDIGRQIVFTVTENGKEKDISNMHVMIQIQKPDGYFVLDDITIVDNKIVLTTTAQMTVTYGLIPYQLSIYSGNILISTVTGYIDCDKAVVQSDEIESTSEFNVLQEVIEEVARIHDIAAMEVIAQQVSSDRDAVEDMVDGIVSDATASARNAQIAKSYAVGGTGMSHDGVPDTVDNAMYYCQNTKDMYNRLLDAKKIILYANAWDTANRQQVSVEGVTGDEDNQLITVFPKTDSLEEYAECNVMAIQQGNGYLLFQCDSRPNSNLNVYVISQVVGNNAGINYYGTDVPSDNVGVNGNLYLQYNEDGIVRAFGKTLGHWTPINSSGGSNAVLFDTTAANVSGGILEIATTYAGGNFINTDSIITSIEPGNWRIDGEPVTYTATQDCAAVYYVASQDSYRSLDVYINAQGIVVDGVQSKDPMYIKGVQFLKGGQTIGITGYNTHWANYAHNYYLRIYPTMSNTVT